MRVHLAAGELVRLGDPEQLKHAGQDLERPGVDRAGVAGDPDRGTGGAGHGMRRQAHLADGARARARSGPAWSGFASRRAWRSGGLRPQLFPGVPMLDGIKEPGGSAPTPPSRLKGPSVGAPI